MDKTKWKAFPQLNNANELSKYLNSRITKSRTYYHYTSAVAVNNILGQKTFCVSSVKRFNDDVDKMQFTNHLNEYFSLCFSTGVNENLSLWYMYSGMDGKGCRLRFTYHNLMKLIYESKMYFCEYDYDNHKPIGIKVELNSNNSEKCLMDVLYYRDSAASPFVDLKYSTMTNYGNVSKEELSVFKTTYVGFAKKIIWSYEKECRFLIKIKGSLLDSINEDKSYAVLLEIPNEALKRMTIQFAPEIDSLDYADEFVNIKQFMMSSSNLRLSEHHGEIHMNLCSKCNKKTIENKEKTDEKDF